MSIKWFLKTFALFTILVGFSFVQVRSYQKPTWEQKDTLQALIDQRIDFNFSKLVAAPGTSADKARALYYYVAGPSTNGYPDGHSGPANGLFGMVEAILKHPSMTDAFEEAGIASCSSLPVTGSISAREHSNGELTLSFYPGQKTIPSHFNLDPGETFTNRIQIDTPSGHLISVEMNCPENGVTSGYMVMESGRRLEFYYQFNTQSQAQQMDAYMDYPPALGNSKNEKLALRFESDDSDRFRFWAVRTTDDAAEGSLGVAVEGDRSQNKAEVRVIEDSDATPDEATDLDAAPASCISLIDGTVATSCPGVTAAAPTVHGNDFDIPGTDAVPVQTIELLRAGHPHYQFASTTVGSSNVVSVTLTNVGSQDVTSISHAGLAAPFSFSGGSYPGTAGTCATTLVAGSSCSLELNYSPSVAGSSTDTLVLSYVSGGLNYESQIYFTGGASAPSPAVLTISESDPYDFGSVTVGSSASHLFTVSNNGGQTATSISEVGLSAPFRFSGGAFPGVSGTCGASLAAGASCQIEVEFAPTVVGVSNDVIDLNYNDGAAVQTAHRSLTGAGTSVAVAVLSIAGPNPYDYGSVSTGGTQSHTFTVTNSGSATATSLSEVGLAAPYAFLGGSYPGTGGTCGVSVAAGASCDLVVEYAPVATGVHNGSLILNYNDGSSATSLTHNLTGTGVNSPGVLVISNGPTFDYGSVAAGSTLSHVFTVTNNGGSFATSIADAGGLAAPFDYAGGFYPGVGGTCGSTLAAGASCNIEVEFAPAFSGAYPDTIILNYHDGTSAQVSSRNIQGTSP